MSKVEDDEVSSSEPAEDLWNIAITTKPDSSSVPLKSSNEILTELFGAFNAEPPKCALASDNSDVEGKVKKHKKKHKKEKKHKKKSKSKRRLSGDQDISSAGCSSDSENEHEKHEKHKEKRHRPKRKHHSKGSDPDSGDERKSKKRARLSKSPSDIKKEPVSDSKNDDGKENHCTSSIQEVDKKENGVKEEAPDEVSSSTPAPCNSPPSLPTSKEDGGAEGSIFEQVKPTESNDEKCDKSKPAMGKIVIKDLKFSSVYEATVKEVEEQAKAKAEKYEEGELSDSSSQKTSNASDDPVNESNADAVSGASADPNKSEDNSKRSKRSPSREKTSSHHRKSKRRSRSRSKSREHDHKSKDKDRHSKHRDRDRDKEKERHKEKERDRHRDRGRDRSREKDREKERNRDRDRKDKDHKDRRRGRSRSRSRSPRSSRNRSSSRNRRRHSRDRRRSRSRSRDRKRSSGGDHIDKKKLLEIARKNAMNMLQAGILPGIIGKPTTTAPTAATPAPKPEKTAAKTVDELTEYCKELSKRENMGELSSLSGSEDSDSEKPFHHPFQVKDRPSFIALNIKNAVQLPLKSVQERCVEQSQLRIQFPVSSGQQHRKTEHEWVPVVPPKKSEEKKSTALKAIEAPKPAEPIPRTSMEVVDIGTLVSQRLAAIRKKHDSEQTQYIDHMQGWNNALPGQYTGDTGVRLLTPQQLASGAQAWARKDQLVSAAPVRSGMGMTLLQKMGWKPGEGLGKNKEGCQEPLQLEVKMDRKGLVAPEEIRSRRQPPTVSQPRQPKAAPLTLEGKHPVSLLTEYCSKRHFGAPQFEVCHESGPDHKKDFLFKVRVNGLEYTPSVASPNKKQAKAEAASVCLKALGVLIS